MLMLEQVALLAGGVPMPDLSERAIPVYQQKFLPTRFAALRRALRTDPVAYARTRNRLDGAVTAISPYLTHGILGEDELSEIWTRRFDLTLDDKLMLELAWRAFFHDVWSQAGDSILSDMRQSCMPNARYGQAMPDDIVEARTGVPAIDATVRRLYADGYLHNHQRMWLASYCVHVRKVSWRTGADWMYGHLLDGDLASNHLSWQWVAGTFSHKPYLFNADNVARFAPQLASPLTTIDCSYDMIAGIAYSNVDAGPETGRLVRPVDMPRLLARPPRVLPPVDFERLVRDQEVALIHPWDLARRPNAGRVIGVVHLPYHTRFPWSDKRWDFVLRRMSYLCDAVWVGDLSQFGRVLSQARSVVAREALQAGYASALPRLCHRLEPRLQWLPTAPTGTQSFSAYLRHLRRSAPQRFRPEGASPRRLHQ